MPARSLLILTAGSALVLGGCYRDEEDVPPPDWVPSAAISDGVITAQLLRMQRSESWAEALVRIENLSSEPVDLLNYGDTLTGFQLVVNGMPISAQIRLAGEKVAAASLTSLPSAVPVELVLYWHLSPAQPHDHYPCTLVISNLFQHGHRVPDVFIHVEGYDGGRRASPRSSDDRGGEPAPRPLGAAR